MNIGIIGSGVVAKQLGLGLVKLGYNVKLGTRDALKLSEWLESAGKNGSVGTTAEAASFGEIIFLATAWSGTEQAIINSGVDNFKDKIVVDVTNPLDISQGFPPKMKSAPGNSGADQIAKWIPGAKIVKAFNTINAYIMVGPKREEGDPVLLICGDDEDGKKFVQDIAEKWGWISVVDLGGLDKAYLLEAFAQIWIEYGFKNNIWTHAFSFLKK